MLVFGMGILGWGHGPGDDRLEISIAPRSGVTDAVQVHCAP
ncbi:Hypothetical protein I596_1647 [Dokdonella koreensis DS-123]|uniref:Uncharacterized protein n=1 Tax=Dokdonella koreensis DS-123 TaxID=1300342 RepID=A0A160DUG2_9GAMM|nr:Hypothetical protein I596_1647 [Dokdonella koreensis DS-123]